MTYIIGNAVHDENGKATGGQAGDQLQKDVDDWEGEVKLQMFYKSSKGWNILRLKSAKYAKKIAKLMRKACNNANIGYSQDDRYGVIKNGVKSKIPINCDCSSLVRECLQEATGIEIPDFNTTVEVSVLERTGLFQPMIEYTDDTTLYTGDILVTKTKGHTAIMVEGMPRTNPYKEPTLCVTSKAIIKANHYAPADYLYSGDGVCWVQYELCRVGFQQKIDSAGGIDGICGDETVRCIESFQRSQGLEVDGICGKNTRKALKKA
mgnify:CR=1 FL=1